MNTLTYKTQTEVEAIVRRFWGPYFGSMLACILLAAGLFYGSGNTGVDFRVEPGFTLAEGLFLAGAAVLFVGFFVSFIMSLGELNMSTKQVSTSKCEQLVQWMESHPQIQQHIERIRAERAVLEYDYGVMKNWVAGHEDRQRLARQEAACKHVHGIA